MKEFKGFISDDGLKIGTEQDVLNYEKSLKIPKFLEDICKYNWYNDHICEFQFAKEDLHNFLTNTYVVQLFWLLNGEWKETVTTNAKEGTITYERNYETKRSI
jgi:hypothetical protein